VSLLDKIKRGRITGPVKLLVYGAAGVGKSSFAAGAPNPIFIDCEKRTDHLDVARVQPDTWDEVLLAIKELITNPGEFKTVVIDTLDHMELLMHRAVCERNGWPNIEEPGYGKGYAVALLEWQNFLTGCDRLRAKGLTVVLLAHSAYRTVKNPSGDDYDTIALKLKGGPKTNSGDLVRERMDLVGYAHFEDLTKAKVNKADPKTKAITTGERLLTFKHHPAFETKNGIGAKDEIKLSWAAFEAMFNNGGK
jgi:hypothetical protein